MIIFSISPKNAGEFIFKINLNEAWLVEASFARRYQKKRELNIIATEIHKYYIQSNM